MDDEKLKQEIETYKELASKDKKIDVATLMINALQKHQVNLLPIAQKRWAYLFSLAIPPLGIFFVVKFYLSDKEDGTQAAVMCLILTIVSIVLTVVLIKGLLSGMAI
jgi:Na+-driven multidrug efflux pump